MARQQDLGRDEQLHMGPGDRLGRESRQPHPAPHQQQQQQQSQPTQAGPEPHTPRGLGCVTPMSLPSSYLLQLLPLRLRAMPMLDQPSQAATPLAKLKNNTISASHSRAKHRCTSITAWLPWTEPCVWRLAPGCSSW
jgi:hypothetical protein